MTALAAAGGIGLGMMAVPTAAFAIPVGGWCYSDSYDVQTVSGEVRHPLITTRTAHNASSTTTLDWTLEQADSTTYTSTYTTSASFSAGVDLGVINVSVNYATSQTTTETITMTTTSRVTAHVPPLTDAWADYATFGMQTSGTYNQTKYACDDPDNYPTTTVSGSLSAYSLTSVGWYYWDSSGSSGKM